MRAREELRARVLRRFFPMALRSIVIDLPIDSVISVEVRALLLDRALYTFLLFLAVEM